ncbi:hypothetical protein PVAP13_2KG232700 [Panicum virgatum]|uniref:Uncharacterized protein n=1 Tax=Panicum virgatum TaxID=38727 RepID=A0A8T0W548_PANVG|nr:hypothetical protein PVAP13_2KG232700 [Panicum virgatum]
MNFLREGAGVYLILSCRVVYTVVNVTTITGVVGAPSDDGHRALVPPAEVDLGFLVGWILLLLLLSAIGGDGVIPGVFDVRVSSPLTKAAELVSIILKLFIDVGSVLGGVLGDALWRSVSFSAFARWRRISSLVVGFTSGLSSSSPVRLEPFAGLRASFVGAGNLSAFSFSGIDGRRPMLVQGSRCTMGGPVMLTSAAYPKLGAS